MKKKVLLGLAIGMSLSTVAFASPLQNYDAGKAEVNVGTTLAPAMASGSDNGETFKSDVKNKINGGATVGLGRNLALQFKYVDSQQKPSGTELNMRTQEYNLRYKVDKNVSVYAGEMHARAGVKNSFVDASATRNIFQAGVQYEAPLSKNVTGWAGMGFGSNMQHYEAGIGYALTENLDLDLSYQYTQVKDFERNDRKYNTTVKGLYAGLSFKF